VGETQEKSRVKITCFAATKSAEFFVHHSHTASHCIDTLIIIVLFNRLSSPCRSCCASLEEACQQRQGLHHLIVAFRPRANLLQDRRRLVVARCSNSFSDVLRRLSSRERHSLPSARLSNRLRRRSKRYRATFPWKKVSRLGGIFST